MSGVWIAWMKTWNVITSFGKIKPPNHEDVRAAMVKEYFETEMAFLDHTARAEYHDAMSAMLYHRRKRLVEDPFNARFFEDRHFSNADDDEPPPPPPTKGKKGGGEGPKTH